MDCPRQEGKQVVLHATRIEEQCGHDSLDGDGEGNWVCLECENTYSSHTDSTGFNYYKLVREGHVHRSWIVGHMACRYCDYVGEETI